VYYDYVGITGYTYTTTTYTYNTITTNASTISTTYAYVAGSGNYQVNALSMQGQEELLITGDTVLYVVGDLSMAGNSQITIMPGASLKIFVGGQASLAGNGIMNLGQDSTKYALYGLPTCSKIDVSGNASFTGVIYAPEADVKLNGSGQNVYDISGAVVANTAYFKGNFQFHYDERLGREGGKSQYRVAFWSEI
jgi:choice-of-anchor A domain-containing protein